MASLAARFRRVPITTTTAQIGEEKQQSAERSEPLLSSPRSVLVLHALPQRAIRENSPESPIDPFTKRPIDLIRCALDELLWALHWHVLGTMIVAAAEAPRRNPIKFYRNSHYQESDERHVYGLRSFERDVDTEVVDQRNQRFFSLRKANKWPQGHRDRYTFLDKNTGIDGDLRNLRDYESDHESRSIETLLKHIICLQQNGGVFSGLYDNDAHIYAKRVLLMRIFFHHKNYLALENFDAQFANIGIRWIDTILELCKKLGDGYRHIRPDIFTARQDHVNAIYKIKECFNNQKLRLLHPPQLLPSDVILEVLSRINESIREDIAKIDGLSVEDACEMQFSDDTVFACLYLTPRVTLNKEAAAQDYDDEAVEEDIEDYPELEVDANLHEVTQHDNGFTTVVARNAANGVGNAALGVRYFLSRESGKAVVKKFPIPDPLSVSHLDILTRAIDSLGRTIRSILFFGLSIPDDTQFSKGAHLAQYFSAVFLYLHVPKGDRILKRMRGNEARNWDVPMFIKNKKDAPNVREGITIREHAVLQVGEFIIPARILPRGDLRDCWDAWFLENDHCIDWVELLKKYPFSNDPRFLFTFLKNNLVPIDGDSTLSSDTSPFGEMRNWFSDLLMLQENRTTRLRQICASMVDDIDSRFLPLAACLSHQAVQRTPDSIKVANVTTAISDMLAFQEKLRAVFLDPKDDDNQPLEPGYTIPADHELQIRSRFAVLEELHELTRHHDAENMPPFGHYFTFRSRTSTNYSRVIRRSDFIDGLKLTGRTVKTISFEEHKKIRKSRLVSVSKICSELLSSATGGTGTIMFPTDTLQHLHSMLTTYENTRPRAAVAAIVPEPLPTPPHQVTRRRRQQRGGATGGAFDVLDSDGEDEDA
eukprot:gene25257-33785_t